MNRLARLRNALWWCIPTAGFIALYWYGLRAWFQQDDFAWLGQRLAIHDWRSFFEELFTPRAQGTIRPWSERLFFIVLFDRFGLDHRPYHLVVAATQVLNLILLQAIALRLTTSRLAALAAPLIWLCGIGLATPLSWVSAYNEVLCAAFLLGAFWLLLNGRFAWQFVVFVLGFGALEINIVYPALALGYLWLYRRQEWHRSLWLFAVSAAYAVLHFRVAANPTDGPYAQHWGPGMFRTLLEYCGLALTGGPIEGRRYIPESSWLPLAWTLGLLILAFAVWCWRRGERLPAFGLWWFLAVLGPVLPLRDHVMDYYLAIPSIGLALILGVALREAFRHQHIWKVVAVALILAQTGYSVTANRRITRWRFERGHRFRALMEGIGRAHELHPNQFLVIQGLDSEMFWSGFLDRGYRVYGATEVCIAPGDEKTFDPHPELGDVTQFVCDPAIVARSVSKGNAQVYRFEGTVLRRITRKYGQALPSAWFELRPRSINVGLPVFSSDLGPGWHDSEGDWRWMQQSAQLTLAAPTRPDESLVIQGYAPDALKGKTVTLRVSSGPQLIGQFQIDRPSDTFEAVFPLPPALLNQPSLPLRLDLDRVLLPNDNGRQLGMPISRVSLR